MKKLMRSAACADLLISCTDGQIAEDGRLGRRRAGGRRSSACVRELCTAALTVLGLCAAPVGADPVLQESGDFLTDYLTTTTTGVQDVRPLVQQRGVGLDGHLRAGAGFRMHLAGNPMGGQDGGIGGYASLAGVRLHTGTYALTEIDLALPSEGISWVVGRSYNPRQQDATPAYITSGGYQGNNWFQLSQPEILLYEGATDDEDVVYLVYGADRYIEFLRDNETSDEFKATNGAAGVVQFEAGAVDEPDTYTYIDPHGYEWTFFGFDADASPCEGQFWKGGDPAGNVIYVGDDTTGSTAISGGYNGSGQITTAYDPAGRRYSYTYTSGLLTEVKAEINTGSWVEVGKVQYAYYIDADSYGQDDDLKQVTITTPLSDSGVSLVKKRYFRYYEGAYDAGSNPGYEHLLKYIYDFEGVRRYDWDQDSTLDDDHLTASNENLKAYAEAYFEYDTDRRIIEMWANGECGCSGGATGTHTFAYESNGSFTNDPGYDVDWESRTIVERPDGSFVTQYFDEIGQPLSRVITDQDPDNMSPETWATEVERDTTGMVITICSPAANASYTHSSGDFTRNASTGLITTLTRISSGDLTGFLSARKHQEGTTGTAYFDEKITYEATTTLDRVVGDVTIVRPAIDTIRRYHTETTSEGAASNYDEQAFATTQSGADDLVLQQLQATQPTVTTGTNGSNTAVSSKQYFDDVGRAIFAKSATDDSGDVYRITYREYADGRLVKSIEDADTTLDGVGEDFENVTIPTGFESENDPNGANRSVTAAHRVTTYTYDAQGRLETTTLPDGRVTRVYYSRLADGRSVTLRYPKYVSGGTPTYHGPVSFTVANQAGGTEASGIIALSGNTSTTALTSHVDETDSDPLDAFDSLGTVARYSVSIYDDAGARVESMRAYFEIPSSGAGSDGTHYDATLYGYDDMGRRWRVKEPTGTIHRTVFDDLGRTTAQWIGDNDSSFSGGESSGTDTMVKTEAIVYDGGNDGGNSYVTQRTAYVVDGTTDQRVTTFTNDYRGRTIVVVGPNAPFPVSLYDNLGRVIAVGLYSSSSGLTASTNPTSTTTNRIALTETFYDAMGRAYLAERHEVDDSDGSLGESLLTNTWYDEEGRVIKVDGSQLSKSFYDRLGRSTHHFTLAVDLNSGGSAETSYADAKTVADDIVLVEQQTSYESLSSDNVLMSAVIERHHDDYGGSETEGALDSNADGDALLYTAANVSGRTQISASWFDDLDRLQDSVAYGDYGGSNFDRDGLSVPARSDTALRTTYAYNDDGTVQQVTDPRGLVTRTLYDDAGRTIATIRNYVNGTPSGPTGDDDLYTRYVYTDGLQTKMWVDLDGDDVEDSDDQVTTYTYGTVKGASAEDSKIATGHLLQKVTYPDSGSGTDVVTFAYNAQGEQIWSKDQAGNILETTLDDSGRQLHRRATTIIGGFDDAVKRITMAYDSWGRVSTVTQYDHATAGSGSVVDEVKYTWDDWGNLATFEQDRDSAVGAGTPNDYELRYAWEKATTGRNTLRATTLQYVHASTVKATVTYEYLSANSLHDAEASRVTRVKLATTVVASYAYNGMGSLVGTQYNEPGVFSQVFDPADTDDFRDLDRFNRITRSRWTSDLATDVDFYDVELAYDRNSNITLAEDNIHAGFDVEYSLDNLDRLTQAEEGSWSGSAITSRTRDQLWTLDQVGNWELAQLDLDGDNNFNEADEYNDDRTHNKANELTARDTDDNGTDNFTLAHDAVGNLTDDGEHYEFVYDAFGRLRKVLDRSDDSLVAEYRYNGLNYRISVHQDTDLDGDVDGNDKWFHFACDERWRIIATFREADSDAKEAFVHHAAGLDGSGSSSYIDSVILRDRDANTAWTAASDGTLEERGYLCQNWRADLVALISDGRRMAEWAKYSAYGVPFGLPAGDTDSDGDCDATDIAQIQSWIDAPAYDVRGDLDLDGDVDSTDKSITQSNFQGVTLGWDALSDYGNRHGYAGYEYDQPVSLYHVRNRVLDPHLGRWLRRDPLGYVDGMSLYEYVGSRAVVARDAWGLSTIPGCPVVEPISQDGSPVADDGWCFDHHGIGHCGLRCFRSYGTGTTGGQQCCYNTDRSLNTDDECMGTIDVRGNATGEDSAGSCDFSVWRSIRHFLIDYVDYRAVGQEAYAEIQCCLRLLGIPSGTPVPTWSPYYPAGVTDDELWDAYRSCFISVEFYDDTYCQASTR